MGCSCIIKRPYHKCIMAVGISVVAVIVLLYFGSAACVDSPCPDGRLCPANWTCCEQGCCVPTTAHSRLGDVYKNHGLIEHPWYVQWPVLFLLGILGGILICCTWFCFCKDNATSNSTVAIGCACCLKSHRRSAEIDSAGSLYPPPHYSRCGSFHQPPPPYSEVQSKPDLYPLVITCPDGDGKAGGNYFMVQYFRNYVIRPPGGSLSLSATSTAESLSSNYICQATNEANTIIPPPYSCANATYDDFAVAIRGCDRTTLRSMSPMLESGTPHHPMASTRPRTEQAPPLTFSERMKLRGEMITSCDLPYDHPFLNTGLMITVDDMPDIDTSPTNDRSPSRPMGNFMMEHEPYGQQHLYRASTPGDRSPPQLTSPSHTHKDTLQRQGDDRRQRRLDSLKRNMRKSSLYMPLSTAYPGRPSRISPGSRASSRSAPATPSSNLVPNLLNLTQRVSSSRHDSRSLRLEEEYDPLLTEAENLRADHKF